MKNFSVSRKMHPSEIQLTNLSVGDLQSNPRGGKTAPLLVDGKQLKVKLRGVTTPFVCSAYDKTSVRKALDVRTDEALRYFVYELIGRGSSAFRREINLPSRRV